MYCRKIQDGKLPISTCTRFGTNPEVTYVSGKTNHIYKEEIVNI